MTQSMLCCSIAGGYCRRCDVLVGLPGVRVVDAVRDESGALTVTVESEADWTGCYECGVIAHAHGRTQVRLVDAPSGGRPVRIVWRKRRWVCPDPGCPVVSFVEQDDTIAAPRGSLTRRACLWAIGQLRQEHASVNGLRRQLGCGWRTLWAAIKPLLAAAADDESRFAGVTHLGVDEHIWHHVSTRAVEAGGRGPKELTGMVDLTPDAQGRARARLLDLVPGRSGKAYSDWLEDRGKDFRQGVKVATLDPFHGYKNAIDDHLDDARAVLDAFHVVKLATAAVDEVRRRIQHNTLGRRGRKGDPLYAIRNILRAGQEHLTQRQRTRLQTALAARDEHVEVEVAYQCAQQLRSAYHQTRLTDGRAIAERIIATFHTCPIPEIARLGRTLKQWRQEFLGYFDTHRSSNGGTEAINGLIELHRRIARGFRNLDNYRLRMLLIAGGLHTQR